MSEDDADRRPEIARTPVDPAELRIEPVEPLSVGSGDATRSDIVLANLSADEIVVRTNGHVTATIADPTDGRIVGGYRGAQHQPLVTFRADPHGATRIPVLVGTASFEPELGYAVPPGDWVAVLPIDLDDGRVLEARLPLTIGPRTAPPVPPVDR